MHTKVTMSFPFSKALEDKKYQFHPFTRESLAAIEVRISNKLQKEETKSENCYYDEDPVELHHELQEGKYLPFRSHANFPSELISSPVEEIDSFYEFQKTFVVINKRKCIFRFSATNSLWFLDPFNTNRRAAIFIVTHPLFSLFLDIIIVSNCIVLTQPVDFIRQFFSFIFIGIFSLEMALNVIARGFVLEPFTYLRDSWNCLDFILLTSGYMSMILHVRDLDAIRLLKILRSLKVIKGTKLTVYALFESLMKLSTVVILFVISLAVCAVLGLQLYMGRLTQKCMKNFPRDGHSGNLMNESWFEFYSNKAHWYIRDDTSKYTLCGNTSGSRNCPLGYVCLQGFGDNPINSCTSFDTFGWAFLSIFSAVTNDSWEKLFQMILETVSPWHTVYFIMIMLCSVYINCLCFSIINSASNDTVDSIETHEACEEYEQEEAQERARVAAEARETRAHVESEVKMTEHGETGAQDTSDKVLEEKLSNNHCFEEKEEALSSKLNTDDEDRNPTLKTKLCAVYLHCREMLCVWECCWWWLRFQDCARCISSSPFFKLFILLCILVNPFFMALYHYNMQNNINIVFTSGRYFFTAVFVIEASLKIISMSPYYYFSKRRNVFDFFITTFCCLEFGLVNIQGLSLLWSLKLCRILSHTWKFSKIRLIICIISRTMIGIGYITFVIICMFSILGIQLFGKYYCDNSERFPHGIVPSGNFVNFLQSFVTVSRVILIGKWMESMKNCMLVGDWICAPYFLVTAAFGKFIMLNFIISSVFMNFKSTNWCLPIIDNDNEINEISEAFHEMKLSFKSYKGRLKDRIIMCLKLTNKKAGIEEQEQKEDEVYEKEESFHDDYIIPDCFPYKCYKQFAFILGNKDSTCTLRWLSLRKKLYMLNCNTYYKKTLLFMIVINSFTLTLEDVNLPQRPVLQDILLYTDLIFTVIFFIDMMICWFAVGFVEYFRKIFCWLDFTITMVSSINFVAFMIAAQRFQALRAIQALRILRVLETVSRMKKLKNVTSNPLVFISPILLYLIPCFIIWHSFAIMGVLLFAGKHHQCVTTNSTILNHDYKDCIAGKYTWKKSAMNFDSIGNAYLVLFQMDMFSTWSWFLEDADASRNICDQRTTGICIYTCLYIVMFYIFSLSTLSIIAAIVVFKYNERITISEGLELCFTPLDYEYTKFANACDRMYSKLLPNFIMRPKLRLQACAYEMCRSKKFDILVTFLIGFYVLVTAFDHYQLSKQFREIIYYLIIIFFVIFSMEVIIKVIAFRYYYFKDPWNVIDFIVVILSVVGLMVQDRYLQSLMMLRAVRVAKMRRVLRQYKIANEFRKCMLTLSSSLTSVLSVCFVLLIIMFLYAIFAMTFFAHNKIMKSFGAGYGFETFGQSMIVLFQMTFSSQWSGMLEVFVTKGSCLEIFGSSCVTSVIGVAFVLSYAFITFILLNVILAVVLQSYSLVTIDVDESVKDDELDMFNKTWQNFDPNFKYYIPLEQLSDFLDMLELPLKIHKPNKYKIILMDIAIIKGDLMFYFDVFESVMKCSFMTDCSTRYYYGDVPTDQAEVVSSTLQRQRENYCAKVIQNAWRKRRQQWLNNREGNSDDACPQGHHQTTVFDETDGFVTAARHQVVIHPKLSAKVASSTSI